MNDGSVTSPNLVNHVDHYSSDSPQVPSVHADMISALSDCAVMRTVSAQAVTSQYTYLDSPLLNRRNNNATLHHSSLGAYTTEGGPTFTDMNCGPLNGSPYLNHLTTHLHHPAHHHHHHHPHSHQHTGGPVQQNMHSVGPIGSPNSVGHPNYKWMQVKRNVPKPASKSHKTFTYSCELLLYQL